MSSFIGLNMHNRLMFIDNFPLALSQDSNSKHRQASVIYLLQCLINCPQLTEQVRTSHLLDENIQFKSDKHLLIKQEQHKMDNFQLYKIATQLMDTILVEWWILLVRLSINQLVGDKNKQMVNLHLIELHHRLR